MIFPLALAESAGGLRMRGGGRSDGSHGDVGARAKSRWSVAVCGVPWGCVCARRGVGARALSRPNEVGELSRASLSRGATGNKLESKSSTPLTNDSSIPTLPP